MEIIPVIDIMRGKVVQARGGDREHYPLLNSVLTKNHQPEQVIKDLLNFYPFKTVYIADLDAIETHSDNHKIYRALTHAFPDTNFLIDAGIKTKQCWQKFADYLRISPVIGSESLIDSEWLLSEKIRLQGVISLDFKNNALLGKVELLTQMERWTARVIVMSLDHVGEGFGPNFEQLITLKKRSPQSKLIAAGGIRNKQDLIKLTEMGVEHALLASALHDGTLTATDLYLLSLKMQTFK